MVPDSLLQVLNGHVLELDLLGLVDVGSIGQDTDGHSRPGNVGKLDGTRLQNEDYGSGQSRFPLGDDALLAGQTYETLVPLGVVVLQSDLELNGLDKVPLLSDSGTIVVLGGLSLKGRLQEQSLDGGSHA